MEQGRLNIKQWAEEDRPREKLVAKGVEALSNAELLAILIGSGNTEESAVELMRRLLADCGNSLNALGKMSLDELTGTVSQSEEGRVRPVRRYKGLGVAKAVTIMAACELGKRRMQEEVAERKQIRSSEDLYRYYLPLMQDLQHEECHVLLLNQACRILENVQVSKGGLTETAVDIRLILRMALLRQATVIALCHNHPSGNARPSGEDNRLTDRLAKACKMMNIHFLDHVIVTDGKYYSYRDEGTII